MAIPARTLTSSAGAPWERMSAEWTNEGEVCRLISDWYRLVGYARVGPAVWLI